MAKSVLVIGAGIGGLTAAIRLARLGCDVALLEKNGRTGGKLSEFRAGGFRWDCAPMAFAPKLALEALFEELELDLAEHLRLQPVDPLARCFFPDGSSFTLHADLAALAAEIERFAPGDYAGCLSFLSQAARWHQQHQNAGGSFTAGRSRLAPFQNRSMQSAIARHITSPKLQRILAHYANRVGGSAYFLPAAYSALVHQAFSGGNWHPLDGLAAIVDALEKLARESGVKIKLNAPVEKILIEGNAARGLALADGQVLPADAVISNVDALSTLRFLLPAGTLPTLALRRLNRAKPSRSAFVILLGLRGRTPQLAHHNIFFSHDAKHEQQAIDQREIMPADPTITLTISSKTKASDAPVNQENWLIKLEAPPLSEKFDWAAERDDVRDRALGILEQRYGLDIGERIRIERQLNPADFQAMTGAWRGALFGLSPQSRQGFFKSPMIRSQHLARLYFAGGTTQPGGDAALGLWSARRAAQAVATDLGL